MPAPLTDETFRAIVDAAPDAILLVDSRGMIAYVNPRTEQLFGYEPAELVGERVERLVPERLRETHVMNRQVYTEQPHARPMGVGLRLAGRRRDGSLVPLEISLSPIERRASSTWWRSRATSPSCGGRRRWCGARRRACAS